MVKIKFTAQGANSLIGGFSTGDVAAVGEAIAKHLVEEARVARYIAAAAPPHKPATMARRAKAAAKVGSANSATEPKPF